MVGACCIIPTAFGVTFPVNQCMEDDRLFSLYLIWDFEAVISLNDSIVQLGHKFGKLGEGRSRNDCECEVIFNHAFPFTYVVFPL